MKKSKRKFWLLALLLLPLAFQSCFKMRTSDKKTAKLFEKAQVPHQITYQELPNADYKVRVVSTGNQQTNKAILFIHGAPGSADAFYDYLKDSVLLDKAALYSMDRPGYGYSRFGKAVTSLEEQTQAAVAIINQMPQQEVLVVGHSYGGPISALTSLYAPKVKRVLMLAPAIDPEHEKIFWIAYFAKWRLTRWMVPGAMGIAGDEKFTHVAELKKMEDQWQKVKVPVVHMHGTKDMLVPYENLAFAETHFNKTYLESITLDQENHFIPWSRKKEVMEQLAKFLE